MIKMAKEKHTQPIEQKQPEKLEPKSQTGLLRGLLQPGGAMDKKFELVRDLITSDKNNSTKTRITSVLHMTYIDMITRFDTAQTLEELWAPTKESTSNSFGDRYRINAMSIDGKSREEYLRAVTAFVNEAGAALVYNREEKQLKEGNKK